MSPTHVRGTLGLIPYIPPGTESLITSTSKHNNPHLGIVRSSMHCVSQFFIRTGRDSVAFFRTIDGDGRYAALDLKQNISVFQFLFLRTMNRFQFLISMESMLAITDTDVKIFGIGFIE